MISTALPAAMPAPEAGTFTKRIGYTTYRVGIHFSKSSVETAEDKIARLVRMEPQNGKAVGL